jgi:hypothetical protein
MGLVFGKPGKLQLSSLERLTYRSELLHFVKLSPAHLFFAKGSIGTLGRNSYRYRVKTFPRTPINRPRTQQAALLEIYGGVTVAFGEQRLERIGKGYFQIGFEWTILIHKFLPSFLPILLNWVCIGITRS